MYRISNISYTPVDVSGGRPKSGSSSSNGGSPAPLQRQKKISVLSTDSEFDSVLTHTDMTTFTAQRGPGYVDARGRPITDIDFETLDTNMSSVSVHRHPMPNYAARTQLGLGKKVSVVSTDSDSEAGMLV